MFPTLAVCVCVFSTVCVLMGVGGCALKPFEVRGVIWASAVALMVKVGEQGSHRPRECLRGQLGPSNGVSVSGWGLFSGCS